MGSKRGGRPYIERAKGRQREGVRSEWERVDGTKRWARSLSILQENPEDRNHGVIYGNGRNKVGQSARNAGKMHVI